MSVSKRLQRYCSSSLKLIKNCMKRFSSLSKFGHVIGLQYFEGYHPDLDGVSQMVFTPSLAQTSNCTNRIN